jgi:pilus assembly protein FimV
LQATAPIQLGGGESAEGLEVSIASEADYRMVGKPRPPVVGSLEVQLGDGRSPSIRLTSTRPIEDPLFEVMLRVSSDGNQVLKMYTVALDPPKVAEPGSREQTQPTEPPRRTENLTRADAPSHGDRPEVRTRELPAQAREGGGEAGPAVDRPRVQVTEGWAKRDRYGPVRSGDTLTTIIQRLRQDTSVPLEAAVVATWKANSDAFIDGNMNLLQRGAVLNIPSESRIRDYSAGEAERIIRQQREEWAARGRPAVKTSPGHERYQLKVSLQDPDGQAESEQKPAKGQGDGKAPGAGDGGAGSTANDGQGAAGQQDAGQSGAGEATPESAAMVADLRTRISELQQSLQNQRTDSEATVASLEKRLSGLQDEVKEQRKLVAQQNAAMDRLANQAASGGSGMPERDRYILWLLAGVNLLMLLAVIALWMRLRSVQSGSAAPAGAGQAPEPVGDSAAGDPLTQANAQAAAGEFKQARSTLWDALAGDPQNWALYGRLLDLYEQEGDADQFEEVARRLFDQLGDERPEWQEEIRNRGQRLKPDSNLFAAAAGGAAAGAAGPPSFDFEGLDLESAAPAKGVEPESGEESQGFEAVGEQTLEGPEEEAFDLEFGGEGEEAGTAGEELPGESLEEPEAFAAGGEEADEDLSLDFDLGDDEAGDSEESAGSGSEPEGTGGEEEEALEFDLGMAETGEETGEGDDEAEVGQTGFDTPVAEQAEDELVLSGWEAETTEEVGGESGGEGTHHGDLDLNLDLGEPEEAAESPGDETGETELAFSGDRPGTDQEAPNEAGGDDELDIEFSDWGDEGEDLDEEPSWTEEDDNWSEEGPQLDFAAEEAGAGNGDAEGATDTTGAGTPAGAGQDEDEFEIKLDLAQAWIDMGDQESARGLLEEVENRGGGQQRERAQKMLRTLS